MHIKGIKYVNQKLNACKVACPIDKVPKLKRFECLDLILKKFAKGKSNSIYNFTQQNIPPGPSCRASKSHLID